MGKKVLNVISTVLVAAIALFAAFLVLTRVFGGGVYSILTGSMEPSYHVGSLVCVRSVDPADLKEGDVITFAIADDVTVTHRIAEIVQDEYEPEERLFTTKGDANDSADVAPVRGENIVGKVIFAIPFLGYIADFVKRPPGIYIAIFAVVILLVLAFFPWKKLSRK